MSYDIVQTNINEKIISNKIATASTRVAASNANLNKKELVVTMNKEALDIDYNKKIENRNRFIFQQANGNSNQTSLINKATNSSNQGNSNKNQITNILDEDDADSLNKKQQTFKEINYQQLQQKFQRIINQHEIKNNFEKQEQFNKQIKSLNINSTFNISNSSNSSSAIKKSNIYSSSTLSSSSSQLTSSSSSTSTPTSLSPTFSSSNCFDNGNYSQSEVFIKSNATSNILDINTNKSLNKEFLNLNINTKNASSSFRIETAENFNEKQNSNKHNESLNASSLNGKENTNSQFKINNSTSINSIYPYDVYSNSINTMSQCDYINRFGANSNTNHQVEIRNEISKELNSMDKLLSNMSKFEDLQKAGFILRKALKEMKSHEAQDSFLNISSSSSCNSSSVGNENHDKTIELAYDNLTYFSSVEDLNEGKDELVKNINNLASNNKRCQNLNQINTEIIKKTLKSIKRKDKAKKTVATNEQDELLDSIKEYNESNSELSQENLNSNENNLVSNPKPTLVHAKSMPDLSVCVNAGGDEPAEQIVLEKAANDNEIISNSEYEKRLRKMFRNKSLSRSLRRAKSVYYRNQRSKSLEDLSAEDRSAFLLKAGFNFNLNGACFKNRLSRMNSSSSVSSCSSATSIGLPSEISSSYFNELSDWSPEFSDSNSEQSDDEFNNADWDANNLVFSGFNSANEDEEDSDDDEYESDDDETEYIFASFYPKMNQMRY